MTLSPQTILPKHIHLPTSIFDALDSETASGSIVDLVGRFDAWPLASSTSTLTFSRTLHLDALTDDEDEDLTPSDLLAELFLWSQPTDDVPQGTPFPSIDPIHPLHLDSLPPELYGPAVASWLAGSSCRTAPPAQRSYLSISLTACPTPDGSWHVYGELFYPAIDFILKVPPKEPLLAPIDTHVAPTLAASVEAGDVDALTGFLMNDPTNTFHLIDERHPFACSTPLGGLLRLFWVFFGCFLHG